MKWRSIQALRGVAVLGVVAYHALAIERKYAGGDRLLPDVFRFGQTGVDLFFVISGFVMVTVTQGRFGNLSELRRFVWSRVTRIYPTYWFYFFITLAVFVVQPAWVNASQGNRANLLASFFLWPSPQLPLVMVGWSLIHELWFYLVFAVLLLFQQRWLLWALLLWAAVIVTATLLVAPQSLSPGLRIALHPYTLEFICGALAAWAVHHRTLNRLTSGAIGIAVLGLCLGGLAWLAFASVPTGPVGLRHVLSFGGFYGLLVLGAAVLEQRRRLWVPRALQFVGDISYTVYLSHILVLSVLGRLWLLAGPDAASRMDNLVALGVMLVAVIAYGWLGYRYIERPTVDLSHKLRARWLGARRVRAESAAPVRSASNETV